MADTILSADIRDTNTESTDDDFVNPAETYQYVNNLDVAVDITVLGSYTADSDFSDAVTLQSIIGLSANSSDYDNLTVDNWDAIRFEITPQSTPSSGTMKVLKHSGD